MCRGYPHRPQHHASNLQHVAIVLDQARPTTTDVGGIKHNRRLFASMALKKRKKEKTSV